MSGFNGCGFQNGIALYDLQDIPHFLTSGEHDQKRCMLRNEGEKSEMDECSIPALEILSKKSLEYQGFRVTRK